VEKWGMSFKIGIVGAGGIGGIDAAILAKDPGVQLHSFLTSKLLSHKASRAGLADRSPVHLGSFFNNATRCSFALRTPRMKKWPSRFSKQVSTFL
jgi:hypothetical protein